MTTMSTKMLLREWCHQADILPGEGFISSVLGAIMYVVVARSMAGCSCCQRIMLLSFTGGFTFLYLSRGCHPFDKVLETRQIRGGVRARHSKTPLSACVFHGSSKDTTVSSTLYMVFRRASRSERAGPRLYHCSLTCMRFAQTRNAGAL
jgi:hypothetical protein